MSSAPEDRNCPCDGSYAQMSALSDEELIEKLAAGCHDALALLFDRYYRLVLGIAANVLRDSVEAEDVLQTVFLEIYQVAGLFDRSKGKAKPWLMGYAYHRSLDRCRQLRLRSCPASVLDAATEEHLDGDASPGRGWNQLELSLILQQGFETITTNQRKTLYLTFFEGCSMQEIAGRLGTTFANARHHYYRGLERLKIFMNGQACSKGRKQLRKGVPLC